MPSSTRTRRAQDAARAARSNPYVQRLFEDEDLRNNIHDAFDAARSAYGRMSNGKGPVKAITDDRKVQRDLRSAAESLREASDQLRAPRRRKHRGRLLVIGLVGAGLVLIFSEGTRKALLDKLFGAEEEFEYTSTTTPSPETAAT
jgi:hypothetical protein